jgi:hypothetical protein
VADENDMRRQCRPTPPPYASIRARVGRDDDRYDLSVNALEVSQPSAAPFEAGARKMDSATASQSDDFECEVAPGSGAGWSENPSEGHWKEPLHGPTLAAPEKVRRVAQKPAECPSHPVRCTSEPLSRQASA